MVSGQRLLLIAAEPREFGGLLGFCRNLQRLEWPVHWARLAQFGEREVALVANGAGPVRAASAADAGRAAGNVALVCSMGFCGALDRSLGIGDVFVADCIRAGARSFSVSQPVTQQTYRSGLLASIDHVAQRAEEKSRLRAAGAWAVEMEAAGVAERAAQWGLPFYCVRAVTDLADESFGVDFNAALRSDGRFDTMRILASAMRRPVKLFPELIRLRSRCQTAAQALGEFIAGCRF
jgi:adenosylhomocysteine nucleosidase